MHLYTHTNPINLHHLKVRAIWGGERTIRKMKGVAMVGLRVVLLYGWHDAREPTLPFREDSCPGFIWKV